MDEFEKLAARREAFQELANIAEQIAQHGGEHVIVLSEYEATNLQAALQACGYGISAPKENNPLTVLHTGDWLGQIVQKLQKRPGTHVKPNAEATELIERAINRHKPLFSSAVPSSAP